MSNLPVSKRVVSLAKNVQKRVSSFFDQKGLNISMTDGIEQIGEITYPRENEAEFEIRGVSEGKQTVTAEYEGGEPKSANVVVRPLPAKLVSIDPIKADVIQTESVIFTLAFDKPLVDGQGYPIVSVSENLSYSVPFTVNEDKTGGTFTVIGSIIGPGKVTCSLGGVILESNLIVKEAPAELLTVTSTPESITVDETVTIIADHDKTPLLSNITFKPSLGLELSEGPSVSGTTATAKYVAKKDGPHRVDVTSSQITKIVNFTVKPKPIVYPVLEKIELNPADVLKGSNTELVLTFDKKDNLDTKDIIVILPDGITEVSPLVISEDDNTVKGSYLVEVDVSVDIKVTYKNTEKSANLKVRIPSVIDKMTPNPKDVVEGSECSIMVSFNKDKEPDQADPIFEVDEGLEITKVYTGDEKGGMLRVTPKIGTVSKSKVAKVYGILGGVRKEVELNVTEKKPEFKMIVADPETIETNSEVEVSALFDKAPNLEDVTFTKPEGLNEKEGKRIVKNTVLVKYASTGEPGDRVVKASYSGEEKSVTVHVVNGVEFTKIDATNQNQVIGELKDVTLKLTFNKKPDLGKLKITTSEGEFKVKTPASISSTSNEITAVYTPLKNEKGTYKITAVYNSASKDISVNVEEKATLTKVEIVKPEFDVQKGDVIKGKMTFSKKFPEGQTLPTIEATAGLTKQGEVNLSEDKLTATQDFLVGSELTEQTITVSGIEGESNTATTTPVSKAVLKSVSVDHNTIEVTGKAKVTWEFDKPPRFSDVKDINPTFTDSIVTQDAIPHLDKNKAVGTYTGKAKGSSEIKLSVDGVDKAVTVTVKDPKITSASFEPNSIKVGETTKLTLNFDEEPTILERTMTCPNEFLEEQLIPEISGKTITCNYKGLKPGKGIITYNYGNTGEKTIEVTIKDSAVLSSIEPSVPAIDKKKDVTLTLTFDKDPVISEIKMTVPEDKFTVTQQLTKGDSKKVTMKLQAKDVSGKVKITAQHNDVSKSTEIIIKDGAVLQSIEVNPNTTTIGKDVTYTAKFDKAPTLELVTITPDNSRLSVKEAAKVQGNNVVVKYTTKGSAGDAKVKFDHNAISKEGSCKLTAPPSLSVKSVTPTPNSIEANAETTVTVLFENGTPEVGKITMTPNEFLTQSQAPTLSDKSIIAKYRGVKAGNGKVTIKYTGLEGIPEAVVTVTGGARIVSMNTNNPTPNAGENFTVNMKFEGNPNLGE